MKKAFSMILIAVLLFSNIGVAFADSSSANTAANELYELGLFNGTGTDSNGNPKFELDREPTRNEAVTMLVRLLGKEEVAKSREWDTPFTDLAEWAEPYVGYAYENGLTNGVTATSFGGNDTVSGVQYITLVLRALGYDDSRGDFTWNKSWELSNQLGFTSRQYDNKSEFTRGDVAQISYSALDVSLKGSSETLYESIAEEIEVGPATVSLTKFKAYEKFRGLSVYDVVEDRDSNVYTSGYNGAWNGSWEKYLLNKEYETFKAKFVVLDVEDPTNFNDEPMDLIIYGDNDVVLFSERLTVDDFEPVKIELDVSNVKYLKVYMDAFCFEPLAAMVEPVLIEKAK